MGIGSLKRFRYSYKRDDHLPKDQDFCGTFSVLKKYASHSLETLDVTVDVHTMAIGDPDEDYWIGDLKPFRSLTSPRLDGIFFEKSWSHTNSAGEEWWDGEVASLVDVLPPSIRKATLVRTSNFEDPQDLFEGLAEAKAQQFPDLEKIVVEDCFTLNQNVLFECKQVEIEITGVVAE